MHKHISGLRENVILAPYTTWKIGGPAEYFVEPTSVDDVICIAKYARKECLPLTVIGRGSNILISDDGIPGIVVCLRDNFSKVSLEKTDGYIRATAGCPLPKLAGYACKNNISGFEFLVAIPGTVGGGVACNAGKGGTGGQSIKDVLVEVTVFDTGTNETYKLPANKLGLAYRTSSIREKKLWVMEALLKGVLVKDNKGILAKQVEVIFNRQKKFPLKSPTAGSVFKTPKGGEPAGWYIEQAGLKGTIVGDAIVSHTHANWIENIGKATSEDVKELINIVQSKVAEKFEVILEREVIFLP